MRRESDRFKVTFTIVIWIIKTQLHIKHGNFDHMDGNFDHLIITSLVILITHKNIVKTAFSTKIKNNNTTQMICTLHRPSGHYVVWFGAQ